MAGSEVAGRNVLDALMDTQLASFALDYRQTSHELYYDQPGKRLRHPGEFGGHKERLVRRLLRNFLPGMYDVGEGFVVAPDGSVSHQCDVIVYSPHYAPVLRLSEEQRFFPIESVVAVGEIKSVINGDVLRDAVGKLVRVKEMRLSLSVIEIDDPQVARATGGGAFDPEWNPWDQVGTFIIGERTAVSQETVTAIVREATRGRSPSLRVNLIASIEDYCTFYRSAPREGYHFDPAHDAWDNPPMYPVEKNTARARLLQFAPPLEPGALNHLKDLLRYLLVLINDVPILYPDLQRYFGQVGGARANSRRRARRLLSLESTRNRSL